MIWHLALRGAVRVHLTPGEVNALWHLTQYIGRSFWHLATWVQVTLAGGPSVPGVIWLWRWDPLNPGKRQLSKKRPQRRLNR